MSRNAGKSEFDTFTILQRVFDVSDAMVHQTSDLVVEFGLTGAQVDLMWRLGGKAVPMRDLARKLRCDPSNVTLLTDRMEAAGLVTREVHPTDRRQRVVELTERGKEIWGALIERIREQSPIFSLSTAEQILLNELLGKILSSDLAHSRTRAASEA